MVGKPKRSDLVRRGIPVSTLRGMLDRLEEEGPGFVLCPNQAGDVVILDAQTVEYAGLIWFRNSENVDDQMERLDMFTPEERQRLNG